MRPLFFAAAVAVFGCNSPLSDESNERTEITNDAKIERVLDSGSDLSNLPDGHDVTPPSVTVSVNDLPADMNGTSDLFTLTLPTDRFRVTPSWTQGTHAVDPESLVVTLNGTQITNETRQDLWRQSDPTEALLEESDSNVLCVTVADINGFRSQPDCLTINLRARKPWLDPFPTPETWLVTLSRDQFTPKFYDAVFPPVLQSLETPDGIPDLNQALDALGLLSGGLNPAQDKTTYKLLLGKVRQKLRDIFHLDTDDPVSIFLFFEGEEGAPDPNTFSTDGKLSIIALGGDLPLALQDTTTVGRAEIDWNNQVQNNNTKKNQGVFVSSIVRQVLAHPIGVTIVESFCPTLGGVPFGASPNDDNLLEETAPEPDDEPAKTRQYLYRLTVDLLSLALASTLAHEMGHSLGLVPPGPPPEGLFAGVPDLPFIEGVVDDSHINTPGLNVMQTGKVTNWLDAVAEREVNFNPLNLAYLKRRLLVIR